MEHVPLQPRKHVFVCTNQRANNEPCCGSVHGDELFQELKNWARASGLHSEVWVSRAGCLGYCNTEGCNVVVYPEGAFFHKVQKKDLPKLKELIQHEG